MSATNQEPLNVEVVVLEAEAFFLLCKYILLHVNVTSLTGSGRAQGGAALRGAIKLTVPPCV